MKKIISCFLVLMMSACKGPLVPSSVITYWTGTIVSFRTASDHIDVDIDTDGNGIKNFTAHNKMREALFTCGMQVSGYIKDRRCYLTDIRQ